MTMPSQTALIWLGVYAVVSPVVFIFLASKKKESLFGLVFVPGILAWLPLAMIAATFYYWLYPECHMATMDCHGTDEEKAALQAFRSALASETLWHRLMVKLGRRQPTVERMQEEAAIAAVWDRYHERMEPKDHSFKIKRTNKGPTLQYKDEAGLVEVLIKQSNASGDYQYLIWEETFCCDVARRKLILDRFRTWAANRQISYLVIENDAPDQQTAEG
ncbi:MAG: hypothetical protein JNN17_16805 [Verrucomicrobiaceae bacterium]|nr:hypothetical protein [Verrucomicrobiaceae bacterium]